MTNSSFLRFAAITIVALFTACGPGTVPKATIETQARAAIQSTNTSVTAPEVSCPGEMPAVVGATQVCAITLSGKVYDVTVTITAVNGSNFTFSAAVASAPRP